jgi:hypothetical protein
MIYLGQPVPDSYLVLESKRGTPLTALTHTPSSFVWGPYPFTVRPLRGRSVPASYNHITIIQTYTSEGHHIEKRASKGPVSMTLCVYYQVSYQQHSLLELCEGLGFGLHLTTRHGAQV